MNYIISVPVITDLLIMATAMLQDNDQDMMRHALHCSESDCVLPICINSKVGKIKQNTDKARVKKRGRRSRGVHTVDVGMNTVAAKEANTELLWDDLDSILELHASENTHGHFGSSYQDTAAAILEPGTTHDPLGYDQGSALQPSCGQRGIQLVRNQPQSIELCHSWMENPPYPVGRNSPRRVKSTNTSRQFLSVNQRMVPHQTDSSEFATALLRAPNSQIRRTPLITPPISIPYAPDIRCDANRGQHEIGTGLPLAFTEYPKGNSQTVLTSHQLHSIAGKFGNANDINRNPPGGFQPSVNVFRILSLILQAFDSPHTAELDECYTCALQNALAEIQAAKGLSKVRSM